MASAWYDAAVDAAAIILVGWTLCAIITLVIEIPRFRRVSSAFDWFCLLLFVVCTIAIGPLALLVSVADWLITRSRK